jgi:uracil-DNA glycosylase
MVASNHVWGNAAWKAFKRELQAINGCIAHVEEHQRIFGEGK